VKTAALALRSVPRAALALPPVWRRRLLLAFAALAVLASLYWLWFRDSSFAKVNDVYVTGVEGPQARSIRSALEEAGLGMTTLHVRTAALRDAVANYPVVRSVTAQGEFPHRLTIEVDLNLPVAVIQTPSGREPVAADGLLLRDIPVTKGMPVIKTKAALPADRITGGRAFDLVRIVGLAPAPLAARLESVTVRPGAGIVAQLRKGPELRFGDASRLPAKWVAAARVLAAPGARGASYIDLRLPERPAAGGLATTSVMPLAPAGQTATPPATTTTPSPVTNTQPQVETTPQPSTQP
jgi:cell division protein FtsQ